MSSIRSLKTRPQPQSAGYAPQPALEPLAVRVPVAMQMIGVGRTTLYRLIASGEIRTVKLGRSTLITMSSLRRLVERGAEAGDR